MNPILSSSSSATNDSVLSPTPIDLINPTIKTMKRFYSKHSTRTYKWRVQQVKAMLTMLTSNMSLFQAALLTDLGKCSVEAQLTEITTMVLECKEVLQKLASWMRSEDVGSPLLLAPAFLEIRFEPRGVCLVIGPFNYPVTLTLGPVISALAAGNPVVIKPSDLCPAVANLLTKLIPTYFDPEVVNVVNGAIPETTELMRNEWGLVFFTGSERVGKIIAGQAAATMSPVVLELGGKSPLIICEDIPEMKAMCNRIIWGKSINAGQTCVAPDYVLCHEKNAEEVLREMKNSLEVMFRGNQRHSEDYGRNVSRAHTQRLYDMMVEAEEAGVEVVVGGSELIDVADRYCPTCIVRVDPRKHSNLRIMNEEIFGGILVFFTVSSDEESIEYVKNVPGTPLAIYVFTSNSKTFERIANSCPSGGLVRNDTLVHFATNSLPFGGLGSSGYGTAHGIHGFKTFSHHRAVLNKPCHFAFEYQGLRYAPYDKMMLVGGSGKMFCRLLALLPSIPPVAKLTRPAFLISFGMTIALSIEPPAGLFSYMVYFVISMGLVTLMLRWKIWGKRLRNLQFERNNVGGIEGGSELSRRSSAGFMHTNDTENVTNNNVFYMEEGDEHGRI